MSQMIPINLIDDPKWNSRMPKTGTMAKKEEEKITELARSLESEGQLTPIEVEQLPDGRFELVFGSRRKRAALILNWLEIAANVRPASSEGERITRNIIENEQRENLNSYEQARAYARLRDLGLKNAEIGTKLGRSQQHVSNLCTQYKNLPEPILKEWEKQHPVATFDNLRQLANKEEFKTPEAQVRRWDDLVSEASEREAKGHKPGKRGRGKGKGDSGGSASYSLVKKNVDLAIDVLSPRSRANDKIGGTHKWANDLVQWLIGQRKTPPEGIEPTTSSAG